MSPGALRGTRGTVVTFGMDILFEGAGGFPAMHPPRSPPPDWGTEGRFPDHVSYRTHAGYSCARRGLGGHRIGGHSRVVRPVGAGATRGVRRGNRRAGGIRLPRSSAGPDAVL